VRERRKSRERQNSPYVCGREEAEFDFGRNDVSADRGFASKTYTRVNALSMSAKKSSLSRYCTNVE